MKRILIISDTHGLLREEILEQLDRADAVIHAGDIGGQAIVDTLGAGRPCRIVRGNNDKEWAEGMPLSLTFTIEGVRFFLVHDKKDVPAGLADVDVVVYGHSHRYSREEKDGVLWLNPGSCGRRRFDQETAYCLMEADQGGYRVEKRTIEQGR